MYMGNPNPNPVTPTGTATSGYQLQIDLFDFMFGVCVLIEIIGLCCMGGMFIGV